ncbi:hypothetical protein EZMO1_1817 [Endozoicomonas montiporae CL-33]|uniref:Uncharacterized protein n=1 Tax=Endozoicomonas montiporae CL-33 TaxID=570277 RepID=A0A142BB34_9GAMM|nr:hypothetical protein EZMO1_1817 [Endozoicomonas montiporae CL-33]
MITSSVSLKALKIKDLTNSLPISYQRITFRLFG